MESSNPHSLEELESRYALLSDELDQAHLSIAEQEHRITKLEKQLLDLVGWLRESGASAVRDEQHEPPPPHY